MKRILAWLCLAALTVFPFAPSLAAGAPSFPVVRLQAGMHLINAELASSPAQREHGLMFRRTMAPNDGMLFDFGAPAHVCMWMKDTLIPLSVAFIDQNGIIVNIEDMKPMTTRSHCGEKPVRYALEMNRGWFRQKHVGPGSKIGGLP